MAATVMLEDQEIS